MTIDEALQAKVLKVLDAFGRALGTPARDDAANLALPSTEAIKASYYAATINAAGGKMRRDCREPLRTMDAQVEFDLETPQLSKEQQLESFKASERYAAECRQRWRRG